MRDKPIIGLDVDGVVADMAQVLISIYNWKSVCEGSPPFMKNDVYKIEDIVKYDIAEFIGIECFLEVAKIMQTKKACGSLPLYKGAIEMHKELCDIGEVVFVTKPFSLYRDWYAERNEWIKRRFGVGSENVIYTSKKYLIDVDILIDDSPDILEDWINFTGKPAIKVERPWNKDFDMKNLFCAESMEDIPRLTKELLNDS